MKLYKFKPYKEQTDTPADSTNDNDTKAKAKAKPRLKTLSTSMVSNKTRKLAVTRLLSYQHPTSSLDVGTLWANVGRAVLNDPNIQNQVVQCIRDAVHDAACTKRKGQRVIGRFIEYADQQGIGANDRVFLDLLCPRITRKDAEVHHANDNDDNDDDEDDDTELGSTSMGKKNDLQSFLWSFLVHLYSGNYPRAQGIGQKVNDFIDRLSRLGIYTPPRTRSELNKKTPFTPSDLLESVTSQLRVELKKMYKNGSCDLHQKLKEMKKKGLLGPNINVGIREDLSAVENYLTLNRLSRNPMRIIPLTSSKQPFVAFTERELAGFFYARQGNLRTRLQMLVEGPCTSIREAQEWRLPDERLPHRLTSTLHGTSDYLTEIRNVLGSKDDVARLWPGVDPRHIKTLTLDAGQAYVVGAYAHLPQSIKDKDQMQRTPSSFKDSFPIASSSATTAQDLTEAVSLEQQTTSMQATTAELDKTPHHNLAVNQKAVMQPVFRYRRWLEDEKHMKPEGPERQHQSKPDIGLQSISDIESSLPSLR
ncbi:hypothetical protein BGZ52_006252, partial [Haplosporangium bisporale]